MNINSYYSLNAYYMLYVTLSTLHEEANLKFTTILSVVCIILSV